MKKKVLSTTILLVVFLSATLAQSKDNDKNFVSGIRGGWHSATLVKDGAQPYSSSDLNSFYVGFFNENKVAPLFRFGKGVEYFQNGLSYTGGGERVLHTISVPLYLKLKVGPVYGLGGIAGNFKVSEKYTAGDNEVSPTESDKSNWFDSPVFLGAGAKIMFISVEARYHWGLWEVRDGLKSQYFQLGAAVSF